MRYVSVGFSFAGMLVPVKQEGVNISADVEITFDVRRDASKGFSMPPWKAN